MIQSISLNVTFVSRYASEQVSTSSMGNANRMRQLFRKYDVDRDGKVSKDEFLSGATV